MAKIKAIKKEWKCLKVISIEKIEFEVIDETRVDSSRASCQCGAWQISGVVTTLISHTCLFDILY